MKKTMMISFSVLFMLGCETLQQHSNQVFYLRREFIRPGTSMQEIIDTANSIPNCQINYTFLAETEDTMVYRMLFLDEQHTLRPYVCVFSAGSSPDERILNSIALDFARMEQSRQAEIHRMDAIMQMHDNQIRMQNFHFAPPAQRRWISP